MLANSPNGCSALDFATTIFACSAATGVLACLAFDDGTFRASPLFWIVTVSVLSPAAYKIYLVKNGNLRVRPPSENDANLISWRFGATIGIASAVGLTMKSWESYRGSFIAAIGISIMISTVFGVVTGLGFGLTMRRIRRRQTDRTRGIK
ncbi:MAG: hypothetical protein R3C59_10705 [Planctomycetaceae bacterium]